jgi:hypothetical protein
MPLIRLSDLEQFAAVNLNSDLGHIAGPKIIPNCAMVRINWNLTDGKVGHNVMYASWSGTPSLSATLAESLRAAFVAGTPWSTLAAFFGTTTSLASVTLLDVRSNNATEINSTGAATPGVSGGTLMPDEVAAVITLRTAGRGPSGRGRIYVPGWASNAQGSGGVMGAAVVAALTNWAVTNVKAAIDSQLGPLSLGLPARAAYTSPVTGRVFPARPAGTVVVTSVVCRNNTWDSQRRRGLK